MTRRKGQGPGGATPARPPSGPWQDWPSLHLYIYANPEGVHLTMYLAHREPPNRYRHQQLQRATWRPIEVTEARLLEWARRAIVSTQQRTSVGDPKNHTASE